MKILVVGLGALGTVFGCLLGAAGHEVHGVARGGALPEIRSNGLRVDGIWGDHRSRPARLFGTAGDVGDIAYDMVILCVKAYDTSGACRMLAPLMEKSRWLVLAQNGYGNYEAAREHVAGEKILLGRVIFGAETRAPGYAHVSVIADDVVLGSPEGVIPSREAGAAAAVLSAAGIPARAEERILEYLWAKIIYNACLNPLGALLEVPYGTLASLGTTRGLMDAVIREIFAVLEAMGQPTLWPDADHYRAAFYGQMVPATRKHHSSMLQDIRGGRRTEIGSLNGAVVDLGRRCGVPVPVNEGICALIRIREGFADPAGRRTRDAD